VTAVTAPSPATVVAPSVTTSQPRSAHAAALALAVHTFSGATTTKAALIAGHVIAQLWKPATAVTAPSPATVVASSVTTSQPRSAHAAALALAIHTFSGATTPKSASFTGHVITQLWKPVTAVTAPSPATVVAPSVTTSQPRSAHAAALALAVHTLFGAHQHAFETAPTGSVKVAVLHVTVEVLAPLLVPPARKSAKLDISVPVFPD